MWGGLGLVLALCLLPGGGAETEDGGGGSRCKAAPPWMIGDDDPMKDAQGQVTVVALLQASWLFCLVQASKMDNLRQKLLKQGFTNVTYMVVNHQGAAAQQLHHLLEKKVSESIALYRQVPGEADVWETLSGAKDDFLIYDRCGRLTYHIALPYSILSTPYVEEAIRATYCKNVCGSCDHETPEQPPVCNQTFAEQPKEVATIPPEAHMSHDHGHGRGHHHGHSHGGHHGSVERQGQQQHAHHHGRHDHQHVHGQHQAHGPAPAAHDFQQQVVFNLIQVRQEGAPEPPQQPWQAGKSKSKVQYSWEWQGEGSGSSSWSWHWRQLFSGGGSEQEAALWRCEGPLPASWQWQGQLGDAQLRETWQWRAPPAAWQQPSIWVWPQGSQSWGWPGQ